MKQFHRFYSRRYFRYFASRWQTPLILAIAIVMVWTGAAFAQSLSSNNVIQFQQTLQVSLDTVWIFLTSCLVFLMIIGFSLLEAGFCRQKNAVNLLAKNLIAFSLTSLIFWAMALD